MQSCSVITTLVLLALGTCAFAACPVNYLDLGTGCYHFFEPSQLNWFEAYFHCQIDLKGHLAEIETLQERNYLAAYIMNVIDPNITSEWWVGASDINQEGEFIWMTSGNPVTVDAWNTAEGQPDNLNNNEDCVSLQNRYGTLVLFDYDCEATYYPGVYYRGICETAYI